jgi:hypothetical protein
MLHAPCQDFALQDARPAGEAGAAAAC